MAKTRESERKRRLKKFWGEPSILTANLCDDPLFVTGTKWTAGTGWTIASPLATTDGTALTALKYDATGLVTVGNMYQVSVSVDGVFGGSNAFLGCGLGGTTFKQIRSNGLVTFTGEWEAIDADLVFELLATDDFVGSITNVQLKEFK